jgi:hypothetical protein
MFEIDHSQVGVIADRNAALGSNAEQARRPRAGEIDKAQQRQPAGVDMVEHDRNEGLHARHARRTRRIDLRFFLAGVRGVVGTEDIHDCVSNAVPDSGTMYRIAHRRIHLGARTEPLVTPWRLQSKMMWGRLDRGNVFMTGEKLDLPSGRYVQDMDARTSFVGNRDKTLSGFERGNVIAPDRVRAWVALHAQVLALV